MIPERMAGRPRLASATLLIGFALLVRCVQFGNPVIHIDEQFYLLVGDRMWHGDLPFVDIWDRKPVGLFLIYAAIRLLGGEGVVQYQIVASLFAGATAFMIARLAVRVTTLANGLVAGALYLLFLLCNGGDGGQAPVFYNLLTVGAAYAVVRAIERGAFDRAAFGWGCAAMAMLGAALQVKYSVLFEGLFFGLALLVTAWRRGVAPMRLAAIAAAWASIALLPTGIAWASYAVMGEGRAFAFANFVSIFRRPHMAGIDIGARVFRIVTGAAALALLAIGAAIPLLRDGDAMRRDIGRFYLCWALAAAGSVATFGTYHHHYALPMLLPFAVAGAAVCGAGPTLRIAKRRLTLPIGMLMLLVGAGMAQGILRNSRETRGAGAETRAMAAYIRPRLDDCLFVFSGDPILYHLSRSCLPTRLAFPTLLSEARDAATLDMDPIAELARVMARRPRFVISRASGDIPGALPGAMELVTPILARDYRLAMRVRVGKREQLLYERKSD